MKRSILMVLVFPLLAMVSCSTDVGKYTDVFYVTTAKANYHAKADLLSEKTGELKFGDQVLGLEERYRYAIPKEWLRIKLPSGNVGFVEIKYLGNKEKLDKINQLIEETKSKQAQAAGTIVKKTPIRLGPSKDAELIEILKEPQHIEIYDKIVTKQMHNNVEKKEIWYFVKLADGRAAYTHSNNINIIAPNDISRYTESRKTVSWHVLQEKEDPESGRKGKDYIVAYSGTAISPGADFDRIEIYNYDPKSGEYSTSFAKSGLKGRLPITIVKKDDVNKIIQIRLIAGGKGKAEEEIIQEYSFPKPIKLVTSTPQ